MTDFSCLKNNLEPLCKTDADLTVISKAVENACNSAAFDLQIVQLDKGPAGALVIDTSENGVFVLIFEIESSVSCASAEDMSKINCLADAVVCGSTHLKKLRQEVLTYADRSGIGASAVFNQYKAAVSSEGEHGANSVSLKAQLDKRINEIFKSFIGALCSRERHTRFSHILFQNNGFNTPAGLISHTDNLGQQTIFVHTHWAILQA